MSGEDHSYQPAISPEAANKLGLGKVSISDEVVATIAAQAARKIEGIVVVGSTFRLTEILGGKEASYRGVSVKTDQDSGHVEIDVDVNVAYGINIYEAVEKLQREIINDVEALTGALIADKVNVRVKSMIMNEERNPHEIVPPDRAMAEGLRKKDK